MKSLQQFLQESINRMKPTIEWMQEHYKKFNEELFDNELPEKIRLGLITKKADKTLGWQGFDGLYYITPRRIKNHMYIMIKYDKEGKPADTFDLNKYGREIIDCNEVEPFIELNPDYEFSQFQMEDTMIHEMIHLWVSKDGLVPKKAHGREFKAKCNEVRAKAKKLYNIEYDLQIYAKNSKEEDKGFGLTDEAKKKVEQQIQKDAQKGGGVYSIYFKFDRDKMPKATKFDIMHLEYTKRFIFCTKNRLPIIVEAIKRKQGVTNIYVSGSSYVPFVKKYGKISTVNNYTRFWNVDNYDEEIFLKDAQDVLALNEGLGSKIKEFLKKIMNVFVKMDKDIPTSEINAEDLFDYIEDNVQEIKGDKKNDDKAIEIEKSL